MTDDPTTTPSGQADIVHYKTPGEERPPFPEMMGDQTEEQNLGQTGDPAARIGEAEVDAAFAHAPDAPRPIHGEVAEGLSVLTEKVEAVRGQLQQSADAARAWVSKQAGAARQTVSDKPVLTASATAGVALAVGVAVGFVLGRAMTED
jgi:ElaB/YqjD/DUF883 family membrane-anchored ribosome-binding protein